MVNVLEAIALFENEMTNEILHSVASDSLKDDLLNAVKQVKQIVIDTYNAEM